MKKAVLSLLIIVSLTGCNLINKSSNIRDQITDENNSSTEEQTSTLNQDNKSQYINFNASYDEWVKKTKEDQFVITLIGASYCSHCNNFKPIIEKISEKYEIPLYFYYVDEINDSDYNLIINEYDTNYQKKVPHMFITKNGRVITNRTESMSENDLIEFLKLNMVIE